jgi:hypothetical protein
MPENPVAEVRERDAVKASKARFSGPAPSGGNFAIKCN